MFKFSKGFIYTFLAALFWAISIVVLRIVLQKGENPYTVMFWTTMIASPYWIYTFSRKKAEIKKIILAIPLLAESMSAIQIIGGILIILAGISVEKLKI